MDAVIHRYGILGLKLLCLMILAASLSAPASALAAQDAQDAPLPASVRDSVLATLDYHPTVKAFQEYRQSAVFDLKRARSGWLPRVDARGAWGLEHWSDPNTRGHASNGYSQDEWTWYDRSEASLVISQTIWDGLATLSRYRFSQARLDSAADRLYDNAEGLSLDAILTHIEIYRQRRLVALSELNVKNHRDILSAQEARKTAGASSLADVTQTQGRLARAEASLTESKLALAIAIDQYKMLTNKDASALQAPTPPDSPYPSLEVALAQSQTNNSKVKASTSDVEAARQQKELDKSPFHPQIYLEAGPAYRWQVEGSDTYQWGTGVMLRAVWNLYDGHYDWYNVKGDKAKIRQAGQELLALKDSLAQSATDTWSQLLSAREQTKFFQQAVEYNTQTRDMYLEQFNIGQRSLLDVLDSENELYNSSMLLVTAQQNQIAAMYRLLALGGDLLATFGVDKTKLAIETDGDDFTERDKS